MPAYLSIESISVACGSTPVLDRVSLEVQRGGMVALSDYFTGIVEGHERAVLK